MNPRENYTSIHMDACRHFCIGNAIESKKVEKCRGYLKHIVQIDILNLKIMLTLRKRFLNQK